VYARRGAAAAFEERERVAGRPAVAGPAMRPRRRLGLVQQVVKPRRLLVGEEALRRRALVAMAVVRVPRPCDRAELGVRRRSRRCREWAPRRQQGLLLEPPVRHHGVLTQAAQRNCGQEMVRKI